MKLKSFLIQRPAVRLTVRPNLTLTLKRALGFSLVLGLFWASGCQIKTQRSDSIEDGLLSNANTISGSNFSTAGSLSANQEPRELRKQIPDTKKLDSRYSIAADRKAFEAIRGEVNEEQQVRNDEKALFAELMAQTELEPARVRDRFDSVVRTKRENFNKDLTRIRETYTRQEKKFREKFTRDLEDERNALKELDLSREERQRRMNDLDQKRRDYYSSEREQRDLFEADLRAARKDFDDYVRRRQDEFNAEYRAYQIRWREKNQETKR